MVPSYVLKRKEQLLVSVCVNNVLRLNCLTPTYKEIPFYVLSSSSSSSKKDDPITIIVTLHHQPGLHHPVTLNQHHHHHHPEVT